MSSFCKKHREKNQSLLLGVAVADLVIVQEQSADHCRHAYSLKAGFPVFKAGLHAMKVRLGAKCDVVSCLLLWNDDMVFMLRREF